LQRQNLIYIDLKTANNERENILDMNYELLPGMTETEERILKSMINKFAVFQSQVFVNIKLFENHHINPLTFSQQEKEIKKFSESLDSHGICAIRGDLAQHMAINYVYRKTYSRNLYHHNVITSTKIGMSHVTIGGNRKLGIGLYRDNKAASDMWAAPLVLPKRR
jgi:hypothetical protein